MTRIFGLIVCFFCFSCVLFAQNEDCPIALNLVAELEPITNRVDLSVGYTLIVDPLTGPGEVDSVLADGRGPGIASNNGLRMCVGPPDEANNVIIPNTAIPYDFPEEKSFWFSFKAATSGTLEMLITPDGLAGDFDFMIWEGDCPSNPCSIPLFCGSQAPDFGISADGLSIIEIQSATGLSSDLDLDTTNAQVWAPIALKENTNYFILLDHRRPLDPTAPYPDIGAEIVFGGTAVIEPTREAPSLVPIFPQDTTQEVNLNCIGTSGTFRVDLLNFEEPVEYTWETPSGDIIITDEEEQIFVIQQPGEVCVQISCPIQKSICWDVVVFEQPKLELLPPPITCDLLTLEDFVRDTNSNVPPGPFILLDELFQPIDNANINIRGTYNISKINGGCPSTTSITITPPSPELVPTEFGTCDGPQFDLTIISDQIDELNGYRDANDLDIFFYGDSLQAVNDESPITEAMSFGVFWARGINSNDCFDVVPINIFDATPAITPPTIPASCGQFDLSSVVLTTDLGVLITSDQIQYFENLAATDDASNALLNPMVNSSSTYYARVTINPTCATNIPLEVVINQNPIIDPIDDIDFCQEYNLEAVPVESNGTAIERTYFNREADATAAMDLSIDPIVNMADTYFIKGTDPINNCFSVVSVTLITNEPSINDVFPVDECGDAYNLTNIIPNLTEATGTMLDYSFYATAAEAEAGTTLGITNITASDTYYIRGENLAITGSTCFDVQTVDVTLTTPNIRAFPEFKIRNGVFDLSTVSIFNLDNAEMLVAAGYYRDSLLMQQLPSSVVPIEGTYWVEIIVGGCSISRPIIVRPPSNATFPQETLPFEFPCVKEDGLDLSLLLSGTVGGVDIDNFNIDFFEDEDDAEIGINPIPPTDLFIQEERSIWVRRSDKTDSNIFGLIELVLTERPVMEGLILSMDQEICDEAVLAFQFTGSAPFDITYTDGTDSFDISVPSIGLHEEVVSPSVETTYSIVSIKDSQGCDGLLVNNEPTFTPVSISVINLEAVCDDQATSYIVSFDIMGGDLPSLSVDGVSGSIVGNRFVSDPIPIMDDYSFIITDRNHSNTGDCEPIMESDSPPTCTCDTEAAEMDDRTIEACVGQTITAIIDEPAILADNNDRTVFVLHDSATDQLGTIIDTNDNEPTFTLTPDLAGNTYYISAVSTRATDLLQNPALTLDENRCLQVAIGTPVEVNALPSVNIILEKEAACFGESIELTFEMPEVGPYSLSFFDGNTTIDLTNVRNGDTRSVSADMTTTFAVTSISFSSLSTCLNDMPEAMATLEVLEPITIQNSMVNCEDDGENFTVSFEIMGGDPASYTVDGSSTNINGNLFTSDLISNETNYSFAVSDGNDCMAAEVADFGKCDCTSDIATSIEVIREVSCPNESDGILIARGINGETPYSFEWSTGTTGEQLSGVGAEWIFVSMTDANLCEVLDSIQLTTPEPISAMVTTTDPSCSGLENGSIVINNVQGGTRPYTYSLDGEAPKPVGLFANLIGGQYDILIEDDRGCQYEIADTITSPAPLNIWFDQTEFNLVFGDSLNLRVNANEDELVYDWQSHPSLSCTDCPNPLIRPTETTNYFVTVTNPMDCTASSEVLVQVDNTKELFSPTAFSPNGDGVNDTFGLFGGNQVREIVSMQIFNRWGALLYSRTNLPITDNFEDGWNGNERNGERAPSGIYVYVAEIIYTDGTSEVITGDVALMR